MYKVAFTGPIGSGKTTLAHAIVEKLDAVPLHLSFGDAVKEEVARAAAVGTDISWKVFFDQMHDVEEKKKWRTALQVWGTDVRRDLFGQDYWVERLRRSLGLPQIPHTLVTVDDVRFANEFEMLYDEGFYLVGLSPDPAMSMDYDHASEQGWKDAPVDFILPWMSIDERVERLAWRLESFFGSS